MNRRTLLKRVLQAAAGTVLARMPMVGPKAEVSRRFRDPFIVQELDFDPFYWQAFEKGRLATFIWYEELSSVAPLPPAGQKQS